MNRDTVIGPYRFPSRVAAEKEIKRILHGTQPGTALRGPDLELVAALLECHPEATRKTGAGVASIEVRTIERGAPGFWVIRTDGTGDHFSYRKALRGAPDHRTAVHKALRRAVVDQAHEFRRRYFAEHADADGMVVCPLTGLRIRNDRDTHVDHVHPPFSVIADLFATVVAGGYQRIRLGRSLEHPGPAMADPSQAATWRDFHRELAVLRVVHASANLTRGYRRGAA